MVKSIENVSKRYKNKVSSIKCLKNMGKNKSRLFKDMNLAHTDNKSVKRQQLYRKARHCLANFIIVVKNLKVWYNTLKGI